MGFYLKTGDDGPCSPNPFRQTHLFDVKFYRLFQVIQRFFYSMALADNVKLRAEGDELFFPFFYYCRKIHEYTMPKVVFKAYDLALSMNSRIAMVA